MGITGIYDFSYCPYALGDILTFCKKIQCLSFEYNQEPEIVIFVDPNIPSNNSQKKYINKDNYLFYFKNLICIFYLIKKNLKIRIFNNRRNFDSHCFKEKYKSNVLYPSLTNHIKQYNDFTSYKEINNFFKKYNFIPKFFFNSKYKKFNKKKINITVSLRHGFLREFPTDTFRDANINIWFNFFKKYQDEKINFFILGDNSEINRKLSQLKNLVFTRKSNVELIEELQMIEESDLYIGSNNGFATFASFSTVPYLIFNADKESKQFSEMKNSNQLILSNKDQKIFFDKENFEKIIKTFNTTFNNIKK